MGISRSLTEFAAKITLAANGVPAEAARVLILVGLAVDQTLVLTTPVDTGRARANWIVTTGTASSGTTAAVDLSGAAAIGQGTGVLGAYKTSLGPIFIANNLPYIERLENGHSAQAPSGMLTSAIQVGRFIAQQERTKFTRL